jgi:hypothetical protein
MSATRTFICLFVTCFCSGCEDTQEPPADFTVTVTSINGEPLPGTRIEGGIDWTAFSAVTDYRGKAVLPGRARGQMGIFSLTNHLPAQYRLEPDASYLLPSTARRMVSVGQALGEVIEFKDGRLLTLEYTGRYHAYHYGVGGIIEEAALELEPSVRDIKIVGNMFWMTTHNSGVRAYSLDNPLSPSLIFSLPIDGYLGALAVSDSILAVSATCPGPIQIFSYDANHLPVLRATIRNYCVDSMEFLEHYLVLIGGWDTLPVIFDLADPQEPRLVYNGVEPEFMGGFLYRQRLVLLPRNWHERNTLLQLYVPSDPKYQVSFHADAFVKALIDDFTAVGTYYLGGVTVMTGSLASYFSTVALVADASYYEGSDPPYYKLDDTIWKLEEPAGALSPAGSD